MLVRSRMTSAVIAASPATTLAEALSLTRTHRIRHLPVVDDGRLVGIVSDRDLRLALPPAWAADHHELLAALNDRHVDEVMVTNIIVVAPDMPLEAAARLLHTHHIGCLPVIDGDDLVGIVTETDVLRAFTELFGTHSPTVRVEVQMPNRPGELARVVRLIGIENRVNIAGMVVPPLTGDDSVAIIHLQLTDAQHIVYGLRRRGYRVGTPSLETDPDVDVALEDGYATPRPGTQGRAFAEF